MSLIKLMFRAKIFRTFSVTAIFIKRNFKAKPEFFILFIGIRRVHNRQEAIKKREREKGYRRKLLEKRYWSIYAITMVRNCAVCEFGIRMANIG